MKLKIREAIDLHNARNEKENRRIGKMTTQKLGEIIYPKSSYDSVAVSMGKFMRGEMKKFNPEWILLICEHCGVDPNFLYGHKSIFDDEYKSFFPTNN